MEIRASGVCGTKPHVPARAPGPVQTSGCKDGRVRASFSNKNRKLLHCSRKCGRGCKDGRVSKESSFDFNGLERSTTCCKGGLNGHLSCLPPKVGSIGGEANDRKKDFMPGTCSKNCGQLRIHRASFSEGRFFCRPWPSRTALVRLPCFGCRQIRDLLLRIRPNLLFPQVYR